MAPSPGTRHAITPEVWLRRALLVAIAAVVLVAVTSGLARLGFPLPLGALRAGAHGPLFVVAAFGTVITLERAVAIGGRLPLVAPALGAAGGLLQIFGLPGGPALAVAAAFGLVLLNLALARRQWASFTALMLLGSFCLLLGNLGWALGRAVFELIPAWMSFFVLTIVSERLELSRLAPTPTWARRLVLGLGLAHAAAAAAAWLDLASAPRAFGVTMLALGAWQLHFDVARRTLRQPGLPRFAALGILLGASWLAVSGALHLADPVPIAGPRYDAALHGVFVGYVLSMVFAHAPIILPAVAKISIPFSRVLYAPLGLLHLGLLLRMGGDLGGQAALRQSGGLLNALALLAFAAAVLYARRARGGRVAKSEGGTA